MNESARAGSAWRNVLLALIWTAPALVLGYLAVTDGFLYLTASFAERGLHSGKMEFEPGGEYNYGRHDFFPGYPMILGVLRLITGMPMDGVIFLPVGGPLLGIVAFIVARKLLKDDLLATIISIFAVTDFTLAHHYNVFAYSWAFPLYLLVLVLMADLVHGMDLKKLLMLMVLFFGLMSLHYAVTLWTVIAAVAVMLIVGTPGVFKTASGQFLGLSILFVSTFFAYNQVFYDLWLPSFAAQSSLDESFSTFVAKIGSYLSGDNITVEKYAAPTVFGPVFSYLRLLEYLVILLALGAGVFLLLRAVARRTGTASHLQLGLFLAGTIGVTTVAEVVAYSAHGWVPVKYVVLAYPFLVAGLLLPWRRLALTASAALAGIATVGCVLGIVALAGHPLATDEQLTESTVWLTRADGSRASQAPTNILSDLETAGRIQLHLASEGVVYKPTYYDDALYGAVVDPLAPDGRLSRVDYVVIDAKASRNGIALHGIAERNYLPMGPFFDSMGGNDLLHAVYDSQAMLILRPAAKAV